MGYGLRAFILLALSGSSGNVTLLPCFLVDGQSLLGEQVGWQDRRPQAGRRRRSQVLSSTPAGDLPTQPPSCSRQWPPVTLPALTCFAHLCLPVPDLSPELPPFPPQLRTGPDFWFLPCFSTLTQFPITPFCPVTSQGHREGAVQSLSVLPASRLFIFLQG